MSWQEQIAVADRARAAGSEPRSVDRIVEPQYVKEGAGVRLRRTIGSQGLNYLDPFLLLDDFRSDNPDDYVAGFPMHPHRGIETVTYMLAGVVEHRDTLGNKGTIGAGDVQWMTSGRGIMHSEMPRQRDGLLSGFQLWVNLPAKLKMSAPRYQEIPSYTIPEVTTGSDTRIRVITGSVGSVAGPVTEIAAKPVYLDVAMPPEDRFSYPVERGSTVFAYVFEGVGEFGVTEEGTGTHVAGTRLVVFGDGDYIKVETQEEPVRFLLIAGRPLGEPIARYGPFVMNTREEIQQALQDLEDGTFVR